MRVIFVVKGTIKMKQWLSLAACAAIAFGVVGCDGDDGKDGESVVSTTQMNFKELSAPVTDTEKMAIRASSEVTYANGQTDAISYMKIFSAGQSDNGETFGVVKDYQGEIITGEDGAPYICDGANGDVRGSGLDHTSILQKDGRLFMVSQFECGVGAMYGFELEQASDGTLAAKENTLQYISQAENFGGWVHCAGMTTPWNSHLGSEEYEPDARRAMQTDPATKLDSGDSYLDEVTKYYWKDENNANAEYDNNPYFYGYIPEVSVNASSATASFTHAKHYSMGRAAWELAYVMSDEKTAYLSDDGTNVGFYMYVADNTQDLSAGTLYAAKWIQISAANSGAADLMWIKLGHGTDAELKAYIDTKPTFSDIFSTVEPVEGTCATGFTFVDTAEGEECLKVKSGQEKYAAFLETRRYAAMLGATTEFRKEEGLTFDPDHNRLFVAMSEVAKGMTDGKGDIDVSGESCGAVYALDVLDDSETAYDSSSTKINSTYVVKNMYAEVVGASTSYPAGSPYEAYTCSVNSIASPDNVTYMAGKNTLVIGEDTSSHPNDFLWAYDVVTKEMTRIASVPYGSETTSPFWHEINGKGYLTLTTQHPFGEVGSTQPDYPLVDIAAGEDKASSIGVVGPFVKW